jgi:hypothetical protein
MRLKDSQVFVYFAKAPKFTKAVITSDTQKRAAVKCGGLIKFNFAGGYNESSS